MALKLNGATESECAQPVEKPYELFQPHIIEGQGIRRVAGALVDAPLKRGGNACRPLWLGGRRADRNPRGRCGDVRLAAPGFRSEVARSRPAEHGAPL